MQDDKEDLQTKTFAIFCEKRGVGVAVVADRLADDNVGIVIVDGCCEV